MKGVSASHATRSLPWSLLEKASSRNLVLLSLSQCVGMCSAWSTFPRRPVEVEAGRCPTSVGAGGRYQFFSPKGRVPRGLRRQRLRDSYDSWQPPGLHEVASWWRTASTSTRPFPSIKTRSSNFKPLGAKTHVQDFHPRAAYTTPSATRPMNPIQTSSDMDGKNTSSTHEGHRNRCRP